MVLFEFVDYLIYFLFHSFRRVVADDYGYCLVDGSHVLVLIDYGGDDDDDGGVDGCDYDDDSGNVGY